MLDATAIFSLREIGLEDLDAAEDKLYRATDPISVEASHEDGLFDVYRIASGSRRYDVVRFGYFAFCSCPDFTFSGTACKHLPLTFPLVCRKCLERPVSQRGKKCSSCEMDDAPYLPPTAHRTSERIGNIRI